MKPRGPVRPGMSHSRTGRRRIVFPFPSVLLLFLSGVSLFAQELDSSAYAPYERKTFSRVEVSIPPQMGTESFQKLIRQKPGEPFSTAAIRESVAALQETRSFSLIQLSVTPEKERLSVLFILHPVYYVGILSFPGAT